MPQEPQGEGELGQQDKRLESLQLSYEVMVDYVPIAVHVEQASTIQRDKVISASRKWNM
jgi:hypothetical protein